MTRNFNSILSISLFAVALMLFSYSGLQAQTEEAGTDEPQLLYRNGENLILVNASTGDAETLPGIVAGEQDRFEWSPDGQFLVVKKAINSELYPRCLNIYSLTESEVLYEEYLGCGIEDVAFSNDSSYVVFSTRTEDELNAILWIHSLSENTTIQVYQTTEGNPVNVAGIERMEWSPTDHYMSFTSYRYIMGGTVNALYLLNPRTMSSFYVPTPVNGYYARYRPIWSSADDWFLLNLQENSVTNGVIAYTNDRGDLYLVRSETGDVHRLTFSPTENEGDAHWTEDGQIAYNVTQTIKLTIPDAIAIQAPPPETIIQPEPVDQERFFPQPCRNSVSSPGARYVAQTCPPQAETNAVTDALVIRLDEEITFGVALPAEYDINDIVIGWRPQR